MKKKIMFTILGLLIALVITIFACNYIIERSAKNKTFSDIDQIKKNKVGLVLGTAKYLVDGRINLYFLFRIDASVELFKKGKVDFILVSGDNGTRYYDETTAFKEALIEKGIPEDKIILDYAGFRTLDSVVRAKEIFGQDEITIISQKFHNERALYIAKKHGISAIGFNARGVKGSAAVKVEIREYLARVKAVMDIVFGVKPKFLGEKIIIE